MKILFVHNRYQLAGGEDNVVTAEIDLLQSHGHEVEFWCADNKDLPMGLTGKIKTALNTTYSADSLKIAKEKLLSFRPDIVHVHNFFPQISPSIYDACQVLNVPVVQTLHNYRLVCPGALLLRDGKICELCIKGSPYQAGLYGCYRGSKLGSLVVAHMVSQHRKLGTWQHKVNRFIALTDFAKRIFIEAGFPEDKISVKPNFILYKESKSPFIRELTAGFALFVGRISEEKGIKTLVDAWATMDDNILLKVAGSGPLNGLLEGKNNIEFLGQQTPEQINQLMRQATFLIMPSIWYEPFGLVLIEAFSRNLPVLASRLGSMAEIIQDGENGMLFAPGNAEDLVMKAKWLLQNPQQAQKLGENGRLSYETKYSAEINYVQLLKIYEDAIQSMVC